ncbi:MAG: thioesterase family protein [bacterium]
MEIHNPYQVIEIERSDTVVKKSKLQLGAIGEQSFVVQPAHVIDFTDDGMPPVLATPWLIWFLEHAAREAVFPALEPGESTVGVRIEVEHLAATPLGQCVTCRAHIVQWHERSVWFRLEAHDGQERIARGFHELRMIQVERFAQRMEIKMKKAGR